MPKSKIRRSIGKQSAGRIKRRELGVFASMDEADRAEVEYWRSKTPAARMRALERLRQEVYGYGQGRPVPRFEPIMRVVDMVTGEETAPAVPRGKRKPGR